MFIIINYSHKENLILVSALHWGVNSIEERSGDSLFTMNGATDSVQPNSIFQQDLDLILLENH